METTNTRPNGLRRARNTAVALLAAAGILAVPAMSAAATPTSVSIEPEIGGFFGYVHSSKQKCELNRTVKLYKVKHGHKTLIGKDLAQPNGPDSQWFVNTNLNGKFYAHVGKAPGCAPANSPIVKAQQS